MNRLIVAANTNVIRDESGEIVFDKDDNVQLKNANDTGIMMNTHPVTELVEGQMSTKLKCEVAWQAVRSPAVTMEDPEDLTWLGFEVPDEDTDDDYEESEYEEEESD